MRKALMSPTAPSRVPSSSTTAVPYQVTSVSSTEMGSNTWMWLPKSEKLGKTLMLTGSEEASSRMSSAFAPKRRSTEHYAEALRRRFVAKAQDILALDSSQPVYLNVFPNFSLSVTQRQVR